MICYIMFNVYIQGTKKHFNGIELVRNRLLTETELVLLSTAKLLADFVIVRSRGIKLNI